MRVLHLYSGNLFGGIETLLLTIAKHQGSCTDLRHEFCLCFEGRLSRKLRSDATVHMLNEVRIRKPWTIRSARTKLERILATNKYDAAITHSTWPHVIFGTTLKNSGLPVAFWLHDAPNVTNWLERLAGRIEPDLLLSNSIFTATSRRIFLKCKSNVFYYPVAPPNINCPHVARLQTRRDLITPDSDTVIIQVSRMERWKGHKLHLKALSLLRNLPGWTCWMVGGAQRPHEREYMDSLERQVESLGLKNRVRFLGQRFDICNLLAAADIHCQPNTGPEPFGRTFIEAMLAGLPVVTTRIGAAPEILDSLSGILVDRNNPEHLAGALKELIVRPELRKQLGANAIERANFLCSPERQLQSFQRLITRVVQ
jgi:glycosyltransferase involved in cell wall biosynthesis